MIRLICFWAVIVGYVLNLYQIASAHELTGMVILRVAGIFVAPLGAILGYL